MAISSKCLVWYGLGLALTAWIIFNFTARVLSRVVGKLLKAKVRFRFAGFGRLKDVSIHFSRGPLASIVVGEVALKVPLLILSIGALRSWTLQLFFSEVEIVLQRPKKPRQKSGLRQGTQSRFTGKSTTWPILANCAKHVSLTVTDLVVKSTEFPDLSLEVEEVDLDAVRTEESTLDSLGVRLVLFPIRIPALGMCDGDFPAGKRRCALTAEERPLLFYLEELSVSGNVKHVRERGLVIQKGEVSCGETEMNVSEDLILGESGPFRSFLHKESTGDGRGAANFNPKEGQISVPRTSTMDGQKGIIGRVLGVLPDQLDFNLTLFSFNYCRLGGVSTIRNRVSSFSLSTSKRADHGGDGAPVCDTRCDCGEILIVEQNGESLLQVQRMSGVATLESSSAAVPCQRVIIDVKFEGTQCKLIPDMADELLKFWIRLPKRRSTKVSGRDEVSKPLHEKVKPKVSFVCTISVPEIGMTAYDKEGSMLCLLNSQSLELLVGSNSEPQSRVRVEVGKLQFKMADEVHDDCTSRGSNVGLVLYLGRLVTEWKQNEMQHEEDEPLRLCQVLILKTSQAGLYLSAVRLRSLLTLCMSVKRYIKSLPVQRKGPTKFAGTANSRKKGGWRKIEFGAHGLSVEYCGLAVVDLAEVLDPKTVNFGDQGGKVLVTHNNDHVRRSATIMSTGSNQSRDYKAICKVTFDEVLGLISMDGRKRRLDLSANQVQVTHEQAGITGDTFSSLRMMTIENVDVVFKGGNGATGVADQMLLSVANGDGHWNPDLHLFYYETALQLSNIGSLGKGRSGDEQSLSSKKDPAVKKGIDARKQKMSVAVDLENVKFNAKVTEEVDFTLRVQSLVSEDALIGVLAENVQILINDSLVLYSEQVQICRLPASTSDVISGTGGVEKETLWNISVYATKIHTILPFRLSLRVIDDVTEDIWRVLKLVMKAQKEKWNQKTAVDNQHKIKKPPARVQSILVSVHELTFEIEEEPLQGWLDEHHHLIGREICKLRVQERILEEKFQGKTRSQFDSPPASTAPPCIDGITSEEMDSEWERIQKEAFNAYRQACENLSCQDGSGACKSGLQSGFHASANRKTLLLVLASDVQMQLRSVDGSMVEAIRKLDCVAPELQVPFSKVYGRHLSIQASTLLARLRDFPSPLVNAGAVECEGSVIVAQQATAFPMQMRQEVSLGKLRTVEVWRSVSGATPAYKTFFDLDLQVESGQFSYGVGYEPVLADVTYALSLALQKAKPAIPVVKNERSLPWWDDMRYYIHGRNNLKVKTFALSLLATTNPYEEEEVLQLVASAFKAEQSEGSVVLRAEGMEWILCRRSTSCQSHALVDNQEKLSVLYAPEFKLEILMDWKCESGMPLNHYLHPFPNDSNPPAKKFDLFRSTSLLLTFAISLFCPVETASPNSPLSFVDVKHRKQAGQFVNRRDASSQSETLSDTLRGPVPTVCFASEELTWIFRLWGLLYYPPHKLRSFSRWPRFGIQRVPRSGNLSLDKVMTEYLLKIDATPGCIKHRSNMDGDPAHGLTFDMKRLRYELLYSRCQSHYESTGPRGPLMSVYQGLDLSMLDTGLETVAMHHTSVGKMDKEANVRELLFLQDDGVCDNAVANGVIKSKMVKKRNFLLSMDCFTLRKQAPKAGLSKLSALLHYKRISRRQELPAMLNDSVDIKSGSARSDDASDDEGFNVVLADDCLRVSVYGLKLLWTLPNRNAVWSWVEDFSRAFESPRPSPSRQSAQRSVLDQKESQGSEQAGISHGRKDDLLDSSEEEGVMHFMVNVVQPQFNLHSEDANGRLLVAAASGRVLARSFHSIVALGPEMLEHALRKEGLHCSPQGVPVITWKRREFSVILDHVQAHVAPTDVDVRAGLQWLPKIPTVTPTVRRTGALLERVFMPCSMYFQYTRHKGGTTDCKVKPLKELSFNSPNITATMTSSQFHILVDVISNLLLARLPKSRKNSVLQYGSNDSFAEEEGDEEVDEVVPEGVEEVEVARIKLEQAERGCRALIEQWTAMRRLGFSSESAEIQMLESEFAVMRRVRRSAFVTLRNVLQGAAQLRLMEKEKHRTPLAAMRISWAIDKFVWSMLCDGETFAEAEISSMILNLDRDFKDIGVARFTTKRFAVKDCLPGAKSSTVLSPWNPPGEWGKNVMLRVDAKQGAPQNGHSPLELFQVEIYPLKIYLTEVMYKMMWEYLFPEDDADLAHRETIRTQHQKVSLAVGNTSTINLIRHPSTSKTSEEKDIDVCADEVNSEATVLPITTILRSSVACRKQSSTCEELQATATIHAAANNENGKAKDQRSKKGGKTVLHEEKKVTEETSVVRLQRRLLEFHNIRISQVELQVTYAGSRFSVNDMRLLMDTFIRLEFTGSWRRLFSKVKKHIIWSVLKSVTGMQGKKFKDKLQAQGQLDGGEEGEDSNSSDASTSHRGHENQFPLSKFKKDSDRAGDRFVSSIRGLFNSQRRKAKALMRRTLSIDMRHGIEEVGYHSEEDADEIISPRELGNLSKAKRLLKRHSLKIRPNSSQKSTAVGVEPSGSSSSSSSSSTSSSSLHTEAEVSDGSSAYEDFHDSV